MTTIVHASGSAEFLGIVPSLAGFTPQQSVVLLPFIGQRTYDAIRLDLPAEGTAPEDYASTAVGLIEKTRGADAVAVVVYVSETAEETRDGLVLPLSVQIEELLGRAEDADLRVVDALCVMADGWSSYLDDDPELAPLPPMYAQDTLGDVSGDQHAGTELPHADLAETERVGRALLDLAEVLDGEKRGTLSGHENPQAIAAVAVLDDLPAFFETVLEKPDAQPVFASAALLWCLDRPILRDVALTQWATDLNGGVRTLDAQLTFAHGGRSLPDDLGDVFLGRGTTPDPERLRGALAAVRLATARAPRAMRPGPLTAAAWLSWALGRATHAAHYLELVREIDPQYGLAGLLRAMIGASMLPEWVFRRGAGRTT